MNMTLETLHACLLCGSGSLRVLDRTANLCECQSCRYVFDNPRPRIESLIAFYSQPTKYDSWLSEEQARNRLWERRLKLLLRVRRPGSILDVGAGIGQFLALAQPNFDQVFGTEVSESAVEIAKKKYGLDLMRGEIDEIDFGATKFDNITMFHVLEHVPNPRSMVERCAKLLKQDGILFVAVPNDLYSLRATRFLKTIAARTFHRSGSLGIPRLILDGSLGEIHLSHFTPSVLAGLIAQSGFSIIWNTLDPYYVDNGGGNWKQRGYYNCCRTIQTITGINLYDTMLIVGRKVTN
jgi:SAM-dependent methyltransferase